MKTLTRSITLSEWEVRSPNDSPELVGQFLDTPGRRLVAERLSGGDLLRLTELRHGLQIHARSHVGRIRVGDLSITILPKIKGRSLLNLVRYAYGFRRLNLVSDLNHLVDDCGFEDLLIFQLNAEIQELISRGLLRAYISTHERLGSPRGRIALNRMALDGGTVAATLPCQHHPRIEDTLLNQVLLAGLRLAGSLASVTELRRESRRLATMMDEQVSPIRIDGTVLDRAARKLNRLSTAYLPAMSIIRLLVESQGVVLQGEKTTTTLPGFLFDMNAFFQALMSRFLRENLTGYTVRDEHGLKHMMRYNPKFNPQRRQSPTPRPDYVVTQQGVVRSILDAKYRDLWEKALPAEMLYQLVVYAISNPKNPQSSILYPTTNPLAKEARIDITDPMHGGHLGQVCLRPVLLPFLETLVNDRAPSAASRRVEFAKTLAFGDGH